MCSYQSIREWQTRLVLIKPNANISASLELSLVVVDLVDLNTGAIINHDTIVTYDALSYAWGTASPSIECICDGNTILLRDNLDSALKHLRQPENERHIWVDFLCINQDDLAEKAVQIPRMKNIYSKASTVVVWLGKSLEIENITRIHEKNCKTDLDLLDCSIHEEQLWKPIMGYAWFQRTWVRQEVWAAGSLEVACPYFSTTWELFTNKMLRMLPPSMNLSGTYLQSMFLPSMTLPSTDRLRVPPTTEAVNNLTSLNDLYSSRRLELLVLLRQGKWFQASVPHDHIFSVLGMMSTPKHNTNASIPVSYDKTYHEVCGDVTRFLIRESHSISILQLCTVQRDRTYAFDWPTVKWSYSSIELLKPGYDVTNESMEQFEKENPVRKFGTSDGSGSTASSSIPCQSGTGRPLVLYGRVWGTVTEQFENVSTRANHLSACLIDDGTSIKQEVMDTQHSANGPHPSQLSMTPMRELCRPENPGDRCLVDSTPEDSDEYHDFTLSRRRLISTVFEGKSRVRDSRVYWGCRGCMAKGDIFVALEPGPQNVLLRGCLGPGDLFEVVGWGGRMKTKQDLVFGHERDSEFGLRKTVTPGPRQQFRIR